jgi:hypothetical protein
VSQIGDARNGAATVAAGAYLYVQPPVGEEWMVTAVDTQSDLGITDGTNRARLRLHDAHEVWSKGIRILITNAVYLALYNPFAESYPLGYTAVVTRTPSTPAGRCDARVAVGAATTGSVYVQPPVGEQWMVFDWGCGGWEGSTTDTQYPSMTVQLHPPPSGTVYTVRVVTDYRHYPRRHLLMIDNARYLEFRFTSNSGPWGYCGARMK